MKTKKLHAITLSATMLLAACGQQANSPQAPQAKTTSGKISSLSTKGGKKKIVEPAPTTPVSACTALYSTDQANATTTNAVVDPSINYDGSVGTLILSFNFDDAVTPAANFITSSLGIKLGDGLGTFGELPMVAVKAPITRELVSTLKSNLQQYGLLSIYQDRPLQYFLDESVAYIKADSARTAFKATGKGVGVAVIDSGVDGTHGDFPNLVKNIKIAAPIVAPGVSGALYVDTPNSDLTSGHGTHVASTIAGSGQMSTGGKYKGVAPGASLIGIGAGDAISILYALQGFDYAFKPEVRETHNVRIISNSWGTSGSHFAPYNPISIASKRAYDFGMIVNFAAGNDGPDADTLNPYSASPCVISVGAGHAKNTMTATNPLVSKGMPGQLASFSSRGIKGDALHRPDIVLPGVNIVAARATSGSIVDPYLGKNGTSPEPMYSSISGTSMATPHMSGVAALMLEVNPTLNMDGVLAAVASTANPMYGKDASGAVRQLEDWEVGAGYANAYAAVEKAASTAGTRTTVQTSPLTSWTGTVGTAVDGTPLVAEHNHTVVVPTGVSAVKIKTDWGNPAYDLDLYVYDTAGKLIASSAEAASVAEEVVIPNPAAGSYRVQLKGFTNAQTTYKGTATVDRITTVQ